MARQKQAFNPFYLILVVAGVAFAITACAYGVMTVQQLDPHNAAQASPSAQGLITFLDQRGFALMMIEILILALATLAAISTDQFWTRRAAGAQDAAETTPDDAFKRNRPGQ